MSNPETIYQIDGIQLYRMLANGYRNLKRNMAVIDALNVFPVPDGDTGKNMTMTLKGGVTDTPDTEANVAIMLKAFSRGSLMAARGNSGVILSQIIKGMANAAKEKSLELVDSNTMLDILDGAVKRSYAAIGTPVEGTILTVMKDGAAGAREESFHSVTIADCLHVTIAAMKESLARTPELLPVLKEAGVVDSGGAGLICFFEGMLMELEGETLSDDSEMSLDEKDFHIEQLALSKERVPYALVAVASGAGIHEYFSNAGVAAIIDGGQTNNPSAESFLAAFRKVNADTILVLPGNSNIILTANQAASFYKEAQVHVVPTKSIAETYSAISMFDDSLDSVEEIVENMLYYSSQVITGYVTKATRDTTMNGVEVHEGHYIGLTNDAILSDSTDCMSAAKALLSAIPELAMRDVINIFFGNSIDFSTAMELGEWLLETYSSLEVNYIDGGQEVYDFIISIE